MNPQFVRRPLYAAFQVVFGLAVVGWAVVGYYTNSQWDKYNSAYRDLDAKTPARTLASQARFGKIQAREASLRTRNPEFAKKLDEHQKGANWTNDSVKSISCVNAQLFDGCGPPALARTGSRPARLT